MSSQSFNSTDKDTILSLMTLLVAKYNAIEAYVCDDSVYCTKDKIVSTIQFTPGDNIVLADCTNTPLNSRCVIDVQCQGVCNGTGCDYSATDSNPCDDGDFCTINDSCSFGSCIAGVANPCDDSLSCTSDSCSNGACVNTPNDLVCDDGNECTIDICNVNTGCTYANVEDFTPCFVGMCYEGVCNMQA